MHEGSSASCIGCPSQTLIQVVGHTDEHLCPSKVHACGEVYGAQMNIFAIFTSFIAVYFGKCTVTKWQAVLMCRYVHNPKVIDNVNLHVLLCH